MPRGQGLNNGGVRAAIRVDAVAVTVLTYRARVLVSTAKWPQIVRKKVNYEFKEGKDIEVTRKKFIDFTKKLWIQEITSDDMGSLYYTYIKDVLEIEKLYNDVKNKYNILYSELKIEKNEKLTGFIVLVLVATLVFNIVNFIMSMK